MIAVIGNDASWGQIAREQVPMFGSSVACDLTRLDYQTVAKGYGGDGVRVEHMDQVDAALEQAKRSAKAGRAFLINAILSKSNFREGSISV